MRPTISAGSHIRRVPRSRMCVSLQIILIPLIGNENCLSVLSCFYSLYSLLVLSPLRNDSRLGNLCIIQYLDYLFNLTTQHTTYYSK